MLDRRELLTGVIGGLLVNVVVPRRATARQARTPLQANASQQPGLVALHDRLSLLSSGGTNVLALSGADGLVIVDSGAADRGDALMASLRQLSNGRIATLFNTHWHPENTGSNEMLRQSGATIVAHENTRLWMATPVWVPADDRYRPPRPKTAHPTRTFYVDGTMNVGIADRGAGIGDRGSGSGSERIEYGYLLEAHTSGDIYVFFRDSNVLAVGDVASPSRDPELDYFTGAWIGGRVDAMDRLLALANDDTRIVPGFGSVMSRAELKAERDVMKTIYDRTVERVRQGEDADDMLNAGVMNGLGRTWKDPRRFLYDVNKGLWAHHNKLDANVV